MVAVNPPVGTVYIPYINIGMEFNIDLSIFTYQLAQQIAQVVLGSVPPSSNFDAIIYTEQGSTAQAQTVRLTVKFYDGDNSQINALYNAAPTLVCHFEPTEPHVVDAVLKRSRHLNISKHMPWQML